jgi:AsmA family protein
LRSLIHITMRRGPKIAVGIVTGIVVLLALLVVLFVNFNWNRAKPWLADRVSAATGRSFAINGDLTVNWQRPPQAQESWRRFVPWPHWRAKNVVFGNPEWATTGPDMARAQQVDFTVNPLLLLQKKISVESLLLTEPQLNFEHAKDGRGNWQFPKKDSPSQWQFALNDLSISHGNLRYVDPGKKADIGVRIDTRDDGSAEWKANGNFNGEEMSGDGTAGALLSLQAPNVRYPVRARVKVGETSITADGTLTDPAHFSALDINLKILGASMADLFPLSGVLLPTTPKFSTEGRVVGNLKPGHIQLRYEKFKGKVGSSDIGGTLEYVQQAPRPVLRGDVTSQYLNLKDLGALIGSGDADKKKQDAQPPDKVLPVSPFKTERWDKMDVQVSFTGRKIVRSENLPIDDLHTKVKMDNGVLSLAPLEFGVAGGRLSTELSIDGRADPAKARMKITARALKLKQLFPKVESMRASIGEIGGDALLSGSGNSIAALLGSADGEVKALITQGSISKFILEAMGLNIGAVVVTQLFGDRQVQLNCMATDLDVKNGLMQTRTFVVDTEDATIIVDGSINLAKEELNLKINPESKGMRIISLRSPLHVAGTFKKPDVGIDKRVVALKSGAAVVLGTVAAPLAALLALINPGPGEDSPCAKLLEEARKKPVAPPPGKTTAAAPAKPAANRN